MARTPHAPLLNVTGIRKHCHLRGRRISADFMVVLHQHLIHKLNAACSVHNGGKKTLDASVAAFVGLTRHNNP